MATIFIGSILVDTVSAALQTSTSPSIKAKSVAECQKIYGPDPYATWDGGINYVYCLTGFP